VTLNPVYTVDETSQSIVNKVFDSLYCFDSNGRITTQLAAGDRITKTKNGTEIEIRLVPGVSFSDGTPFTSDDVVATIDLLLNPQFNYPYPSSIEFIRKVVPMGKESVKIISDKPPAAWKYRLTFKILQARQLRHVKPETFREDRLIGTGPYVISDMNRRQSIRLVANPYLNKRHASGMFPRLEYQIVTYTQLVPLKLLKKEIDICELQPEHWAAYKMSTEWQQKFRIIKYTKSGFSFLVFNLRRSAISKKVRKLIYQVLTGTDFLEVFLRESGEPVTNPFEQLNIVPSADSRNKIQPLEQQVSFTILTNSESKFRSNFILFLSQKLQEYNIRLTPRFLEYQTFLHYLKEGRFDLAVSGILMDAASDMKSIFCSGSLFNYSGLRNPRMDQLLNKASLEIDGPTQVDLYRKAFSIWQDEMPLIPLFNLYYYVGIARDIPIPSKRYKVIGSTSDFLYNIWEWKTH